MNDTRDRLYDLLPAIYRMHDAEQGYPLKALLRVVQQQVDVVRASIDQAYDNWFIETCEDWIVPYLGDLVGYTAVNQAVETGTPDSSRQRIMIPRADVANTIANRRRKGTLALLESLARDVSGWSAARAVEFYPLLHWFQDMNATRPARGGWIDVRDGAALGRLGTPFDRAAHTVDVRDINTGAATARYRPGTVALFVWRMRAYSVTRTPAYRLEGSPQRFAFSALGNDTVLYTRPSALTGIDDERHLPIPISRRSFEDYLTDYYGEDRSLAIWETRREGTRLIPPERIIAADLSDWERYRVPQNRVAVDPVLGRILFPPRQQPRAVSVRYHYGFRADLGGGEYNRPIRQHPLAKIYRPEPQRDEPHKLNNVLQKWQTEAPDHAVIELPDSMVYSLEPFNRIALRAGQTLQIRAADGKRPILRLLDYLVSGSDSLRIALAPGSCFVLDGVMIAGRGLSVEPPESDDPDTETAADRKNTPPRKSKADTKPEPQESPALLDRPSLILRHVTLVPGWSLDASCEPEHSEEPSLLIDHVDACVRIEHSIIGTILIDQDEVMTDPLELNISDSIIDSTSPEERAIGGGHVDRAHAILTIARCTVFGTVIVRRVNLAENTIFRDPLIAARRQKGCVRFCYVPPDGSRTPPRFQCQPEAAEQGARVQPQFDSMRYGTADYAQLAAHCPQEITHGADDESEMGVYHDLFTPQREANLRARLAEYSPAASNVDLVFAS